MRRFPDLVLPILATLAAGCATPGSVKEAKAIRIGKHCIDPGLADLCLKYLSPQLLIQQINRVLTVRSCRCEDFRRSVLDNESRLRKHLCNGSPDSRSLTISVREIMSPDETTGIYCVESGYLRFSVYETWPGIFVFATLERGPTGSRAERFRAKRVAIASFCTACRKSMEGLLPLIWVIHESPTIADYEFDPRRVICIVNALLQNPKQIVINALVQYLQVATAFPARRKSDSVAQRVAILVRLLFENAETAMESPALGELEGARLPGGTGDANLVTYYDGVPLLLVTGVVLQGCEGSAVEEIAFADQFMTLRAEVRPAEWLLDEFEDYLSALEFPDLWPAPRRRRTLAWIRLQMCRVTRTSSLEEARSGATLLSDLSRRDLRSCADGNRRFYWHKSECIFKP